MAIAQASKTINSNQPLPPEVLKLDDLGQVLYLADQLSRFFLKLSGRFVNEKYLDKLLTPWSNLISYNKDHLEWLPQPGLSIKTIITTIHQIDNALYQMLRLHLPEKEGLFLLEKALISIYKRHSRLPRVYSLLLMMPAGTADRYKLEWINQLLIDIDKRERGRQEMQSRIQLQASDLGETIKNLKEAQERLTLLDKARQDFISVVSHQFRTPLSAIRWNAELVQESLAERQFSSDEKTALQTIADRSKYLVETLNKIFDALAVDTGEVKIERKPSLVWELVSGAIQEYKKEIRAKNLKINFDKSADPLQENRIDEEKIKEVIKILLSNAINYSNPDQEIYIKTAKTTLQNQDYLLLTIADKGIGIPEDEKERVFDKFFRGQEAIKRVPDGTGLGLYIVKNFVQAHGGQVWFDSAKGAGTTFYLTLPFKK